MVFFNLRTSRSYITAHRPAQSAQMKSGYSWVTSSKLSITPGEFLHSSVETSGGVTLNFANSDLSSSNAGFFEVKTVPKLSHVDLVKFSFSEEATKICAILLMVLTFTIVNIKTKKDHSMLCQGLLLSLSLTDVQFLCKYWKAKTKFRSDQKIFFK